MNINRKVEALVVSRYNVMRIEEIRSQCLEKSQGPFLFGELCIAGAMYAPIVNRLHVH